MHAVIRTARYSHIVSDGRLQVSVQVDPQVVCSTRLPIAFGFRRFLYFLA